MIGIQLDKMQLNNLVGSVALGLKQNFDRAVSLKEFFDRTPDQALLDLGFEQGEIDTMKSAYNDLAYQKQTAFDSSNPVKLIYGPGF